MTKATPLKAPAEANTSVLNSAWALFTMTVDRQVKSRRCLVLGALFVLPIVLAVMMRYTNSGWNGPTSGYETDFAESILIFNLIPQALLPLTALVYASGMIQDEIEEQTITYLLVRPIPRWLIYIAKLLATMLVTIGLTAAFTTILFVVIGWGQPDYWSGGRERMFKTIALFALSLTTYNALFGLLSLAMKRAIVAGVGYIVALEGVVGNIDFVIRKGTVIYHFRVLSERWMNLGHASRYNIDLDFAPTLQDSLMILTIASLTMIVLAAFLMNTREFRVKTPEGS